MKKLLIFLAIILILAIVAYVWWIHNAERIVTGRVQQIAQEFFVNTDNIKAEHNKISITSWKSATVGSFTISGENLELKGGGRVKNANIVLKDIQLSMPPVRLIGIGSGTYDIELTAEDINSYLRAKKGVTLLDGMIPVSSIRFTSSTTESQFSGVVEIPFISKVPWTVTGKLDKNSSEKGINFVPQKVNISKINISGSGIMKAVSAINPIIDISSWPVDMNIKKITPTKTGVKLNGELLNFKDGVLF